MTVVPFPHHPSNNTNKSNSVKTEQTPPILALKELVANLQREQNKIQDLLSSLGFALRSFSNLNQFLELTPLMAARGKQTVFSLNQLIGNVDFFAKKSVFQQKLSFD